MTEKPRVLLVLGGLLVEPAGDKDRLLHRDTLTGSDRLEYIVELEDLDAAIHHLQELRRKRKGETTAEQVRGLMGYASTDFLGTGMSFEEWFTAKEIDRVTRGFTHQDKKERRTRLELAVRLGAELQRIRDESLFATVPGLSAIEDTLDADLSGLKIARQMCTFVDEDQMLRDKYVPLWAEFLRIVEEAIKHFTRAEAAPAGASKH